MNHLDKGKSILILANILFIALSRYLHPKFVNLFVGIVVNKIILISISFLLMFENYALGLSFLMLIIVLINYNTYNESKIN